MEIPGNISEMKIKENNNVHNIYKFEICGMCCYKKVIQVFHAVRPVIYIGGTGTVVRMSMYPSIKFQQNTTVPVSRV